MKGLNKTQVMERLDSDYARAVEQINDAVDLMLSNPIEAFSLRLSGPDSVQGQEMLVKTAIFTTRLGIKPTAQNIQVSPSKYEGNSCSIEVTSLFATTLFVLVGLEIEFTDPSRSITLDFLNPADPTASKMVLVDVENAEYHYPNSTDLRGVLVPNRARRGLVAFPTIQSSTSHLELHVSGLGPGLDEIPNGIRFGIEIPGWADDDGDSTQETPSQIRQALLDALDSERDRGADVIEQEVAGSGCSSGCAVAGLLLLGSVALGVFLAGAIPWT